MINISDYIAENQTIGSRFRHAWNILTNRDPTKVTTTRIFSEYRPEVRYSGGYGGSQEKTIITSIINRIALDVASLSIKHCVVDADGNFEKEINSGLNTCLTLEANKDQTAVVFMQDIVYSLLDEGYVAIVPIDTDVNIENGAYDVLTMQVGKITDWYPDDVRVKVYNGDLGKYVEITVPKSKTCIIENPFYAVMNARNSTIKRLSRKLALLDAIDEKNGSGKLDMIIQLPYATRTKIKEDQAESRRASIQEQLTNSKYGVAYIDAQEKVIQLNRPIVNNLLEQIDYLTKLAFSQIGITQEILDGSADDKTMLNYMNRVVGTITTVIIDEMKRKFLTKTARTRGHSIKYFMNIFKLVSVTTLAELADKFTRNEIMTANELRQRIGMIPSKDPKADMLRNSNLNHPDEQLLSQYPPMEGEYNE